MRGRRYPLEPNPLPARRHARWLVAAIILASSLAPSRQQRGEKLGLLFAPQEWPVCNSVHDVLAARMPQHSLDELFASFGCKVRPGEAVFLHILAQECAPLLSAAGDSRVHRPSVVVLSVTVAVAVVITACHARIVVDSRQYTLIRRRRDLCCLERVADRYPERYRV